MVRKIELITDLYQESVHDIAKNAKAWMLFLDSACYNYHRRFDEKVLIYAQRPDAKTVMEIERWNQQFGRWVNAGAKGIAVFDDEHNGTMQLKHYFDITDTHDSAISKPVPIWISQEEFDEEIIETLENNFGSLQDKRYISYAITSAIRNIMEDNKTEYMNDFKMYAELSPLAEVTDFSIEDTFQQLLENSISYMVHERYGLDVSSIYSEEDFYEIKNFTSSELINTLGSASSDIADRMLSKIAITVRSLQKNEENKIRTIAQDEIVEYNEVKQETLTERDYENEDNIQEAGRLLDSQSYNADRKKYLPWEIRNTEKELLKESQESILHESIDYRNFESTSNGDRTSSDKSQRNSYFTNENTVRSERGDESKRPDEMGQGDELHRTDSTGDDYAGIDLQLKNEKKSDSNQKLFDFLSIDQFELILKYDRFKKHKNKDIQIYFEYYPDKEKRLHYIKESFDESIIELLENNDSDKRFGYWNRNNKLTVWKGSYTEEDNKVVVNWDFVYESIAYMIERNTFVEIAMRPLPTIKNQLNLFDMQIQDIPQHSLPSSAFKMPQQIIDEVLCNGTNTATDKLKIVAYLQLDKPLDENASFLSKLYGSDGKGFIIDKKKVSSLWNQNGLQIAWGNSVQASFSKNSMTWEQVSLRIRELLDMGRYMPQEELDKVHDYIYQEAANYLWDMRHDTEDEKKYMSHLWELNHGYPKDIEILSKSLQNNDFYAAIVTELKEFSEAYKQDHDIMRFRMHNPIKVLEKIENIAQPRLIFKANIVPSSINSLFITEDELDKIVLRSHAENQKYRTYAYFLGEHTEKEMIAFLKNEWGTGGYTDGTHNEMHDSKGIYYSRSSDIAKPYEKVLLKWNQIVKRIKQLIRDKKYMSSEDLAGMPSYERSVVGKHIQSFFNRVPMDVPRPYQVNKNYWEINASLVKILFDHDNTKHVVELMSGVLQNTADFDENYEHMKSDFEVVKSYFDGTYTLFYEKKEYIADNREIISSIPLSLASRMYEFAKDIDHYEFQDIYHDKETEDIISEFEQMLQNQKKGIGAIKFLNMYIEEISIDDNPPMEQLTMRATAEMLREEISIFLAKNLKTVINQKDEVQLQYESLPKICDYRVGDFVFLNHEQETVYGTIESIKAGLIEINTSSSLQAFDNSTTNVLIKQSDFDEELRQDFRNEYLYDERIIENHVADRKIETNRYDNQENIEIIDAIEKQNFMQLKDIAPQIISGDSNYMHFTAGAHMMPLSIEKIGDHQIAISHYYTQNGDFMADPDMEFEIDTAKETLSAKVFLQDNMGVYHKISQYEGNTKDAQLQKELNTFTRQWLVNIKHVYRLNRIRMYINNNFVEIMYDFDGKISSFSGTDDDLKYFEDIYASNPKRNISSLMRTLGEETEQQDFEPKQETSNMDEHEENETLTYSTADTTSFDSGRIHVDKTFEVTETEVDTPTEKVKKSQYQTSEFGTRHEMLKNNLLHFTITNTELGAGSPKEKYAANIRAIHTLMKIEQEDRSATSDEQEILSNYVGWGSLPEAFDQSNTGWEKQYKELIETLNDKEYEAARESTLTAFYTPPTVIKAIYQTLQNMGLSTGNILEPACGVGNFFGMIPEMMKECKLYGIEKDSITGRIAQQLYQDATILVDGYEKEKLPDSFFDAVIGNVPFGQIPIYDKKYAQHNFMVHDYFFAKSLDKVHSGGIIIFITSKFTMDKKNSDVRKYIAQRAELLGAIRLPDNTFTTNAGTKVTSDILFLQKRERLLDVEPDWLYLDTLENGISMNHYFVSNPDKVLGEMALESSQYGLSTTCKEYNDKDLSELLYLAANSITADIKVVSEPSLDDEIDSIPADPNIRNFSYCDIHGKIYFRENHRMYPTTLSLVAINRVKGMIQIRDCVRRLILYQTENFPLSDIEQEQSTLNNLYDTFIKSYGLLNSRSNRIVFNDDSSYCLLCSLEVLNQDGSLKSKADMFSKRTIKAKSKIEKVDTASEALVISLAEKAHIDFKYMTTLSGIEKNKLIESLKGVIFLDPEGLDQFGNPMYKTADEYLSGNVREKLIIAQEQAKEEPHFYTNIKALEIVQPVDLKAGDISVRLGTTWVPVKIYQQFLFELLSTPTWMRTEISIKYSTVTQEWNITSKNLDYSNIRSNNAFGTKRINAYKIIENTLNLRDVRVYDKQWENDQEVRVLNKKETAIAQDKQDIIKAKFIEWIWEDPQRREMLCKLYNEKFNSIRNRTYDGSNLQFIGMNPEVHLRKHQVNAVARILYGGNTLLGHVVGAGKTFEMIAAGMESKRLGLSHKAMYVVPNNIINDFASDFYKLYPSANILVATKKDFEKSNREKFCARIATGDFDGVIIAHSQFSKIPISQEYQEVAIKKQINDIVRGIESVKEQNGERYTIKQMEKSKRTLEAKLEKLNDQSNKDDLVTFEELGVDMLFVDEADLFKNLFLFSKMRNVAGISQTESQKASDLFLKTRYLDELTGNRGVVFATGTPVSNSMAELYTMQRYLQYDMLEKYGLESFDAWASTFGETTTTMELTPEGTGFRQKTRFSKFFNLPELMSIFREVADIQTADMLNLPVPKANFHVVSVQPSEEQKDMVKGLAERAEKIRNREVEPHEDNMLLVTNDGRKLALDQRIVSPLLPDHLHSKVNACVDNVFAIWEKYKDEKLTQLVFCDLSTPKNHDSFNVYDDLRDKLIAKGVPEHEVMHIHVANNEKQKQELFQKVRCGDLRILNGSTTKMGAGTNVQDLLVALHDLDCPWRPRDLEQRSGRIIRQGNKNNEVHIYRYITEATFDAYLYQTIEKKQTFISQVFTSKTPARIMEEIDETVLSYAEIKALACGDPKIMERCNLETEVSKLTMLKASYLNQKYELEDQIAKQYPSRITSLQETIHNLKVDIEKRNENTPAQTDSFAGMTVENMFFPVKVDAGKAIIEECKKASFKEPIAIGTYRGFNMQLSFDSFSLVYKLNLQNNSNHTVILGSDISGNLTRIDNVLSNFENSLEDVEQDLLTAQSELSVAKIEVIKPFAKELELQEKSKKLAKLTIELKMDDKESSLEKEESNVHTSIKKKVSIER